jgi:hypothetical protein
MIAGISLPYESALALLELSQALAVIDDLAAAADCRALALSIAEQHRYHEITHRAASLRIAHPALPAEALHALDSRAAEVARAVTSLGPVEDVIGVDIDVR